MPRQLDAKCESKIQKYGLEEARHPMVERKMHVGMYQVLWRPERQSQGRRCKQKNTEVDSHTKTRERERKIAWRRAPARDRAGETDRQIERDRNGERREKERQVATGERDRDREGERAGTMT